MERDNLARFERLAAGGDNPTSAKPADPILCVVSVPHDESMNLASLFQILGLPAVSATTAALVAIALAALFVMDLQATDATDVGK